MHQRPDSDYVRVDHIPETKNKSLEGSLLYGGNNVSINVTLDQLLIFLEITLISWFLKTRMQH